MRLLRKPASAGAWALVLLLLPFSGAGAQQVPEIAEGDRVRVQLEGRPLQEEGWAAPQQLRGTLLAQHADSLVLQIHPGTTPITVALGSVRRLEISRGVPTRAQSALREGAMYALMGAIYFPVAESLASERQFGSTGEAALVGAALGAAGGALLGAIFPRERWSRVRRSPR
jgi:hypothetical protein